MHNSYIFDYEFVLKRAKERSLAHSKGTCKCDKDPKSYSACQA
jgi:Rab-GTPase-TBC domain